MSLNDPNWGRGGSRGPDGPKGPNQGPPDLDELWRNFNRRLSDMFGKRGGNRGDGPPPSRPDPARIGGGAGILAAVVLALWLGSGFYIVVEGTRGVVLTFGKFSMESGSGLRWRMPWPIQTHEIVNLSQVRTLEVGYRNSVKTKVLKESLMLTDDENIVDLQFAVQFTVKDAQEYVFLNKRPDDAVMQAAETAMREIIGKSRMDQILYESREEIAIKARQLMQAILDRYKVGVSVSSVNMQNAQPPEQVQAAFDDAVKAGQDRERLKNEGQAYANDVIPKARGTASRLKEESDGYKQRVIANAEGEASRFKQVLAEYAKAPAVTRERIYIDTMQQVLSSTSKVITDTKGSGNLLYLPLDKLMQQSGSNGAPETAVLPKAPVEAAPAAEGGPRSRDGALRNRERGER
ncbi:MAG: FtsH protease activity modulator HflK [Betaproteobacteria bacterium]|nr:FtsH protease activity modulator HflK [Betaproteobacteria bacterium]